MIAIEKVDHLGIRITDRTRALAFYGILGFRVEHEVEFDAVIIVKNAADVELNLIVNGKGTVWVGDVVLSKVALK